MPEYDPRSDLIELSEDSARHVMQVLRMKPGDALQLTDGRGTILHAIIVEGHKKKCIARKQTIRQDPPPVGKISIAISLLKNSSRFEWFLEKATEIGVTGIVPLICERTERQQWRQERMRQILISAMLQSQQAWLPDLWSPVSFEELVGAHSSSPVRKLIAHCGEEERMALARIQSGQSADPAMARSNTLMLIGPEGDFSKKEIQLALANGFISVTLGETRLRSETAGIVAATLLCIGVIG